jgi:hypothetical protein
MSPPLTSESCACFFSLLRDKFRSSLDYKMNVEELEEVVAEWESLVQICPIVLTVIFNVIIFDWAARTVEKSVIVELWKDLKH